MKKIILSLAILSFAQISFASLNFHFGLDLGQFSPEDDLVTETFDDDFYLSGSVGIEGDMGLELLVGLGRYSDISHHPEDEGFDAKITITPLYTDLLYNFRYGEMIRPYLGGGVGAYFYNFSDDVVGSIEHGTVFGPNIMAGIKFNITNHFFVKTQYAKHFIPPIPEIMFDGPHNFNSSIYSITFGFSLHPTRLKKLSETERHYDTDQKTQENLTENYPYTEQQEKVLVSIQQTEYRLSKLEKARQTIKAETDLLLEDKEKNRSRINELETQLHKLEQEIDSLNKRIDKLQAKWNKISHDGKPILEHTYYIEKHYHVSPWDLRYRSGCLYHPFDDFYCRDPRHYFPKNKDDETIEEKKKRLEDKKEHIQRYKNRKMNEILQPENKESKRRYDRGFEVTPKDDGFDRIKEPKDDASRIEPLDDNSKKEHINRYKNRKKLIECEENCEDEDTGSDGSRRYKRR
jgi:hypothetical protein